MATDIIGIRHYCCYKCRTLICLHDDILSKTYQCRGRAYLLSHAKNVVLGPLVDRLLISGAYTVADAFCGECGEELGWKYHRAHDDCQKFKEGKFVFEKFKLDMETW